MQNMEDQLDRLREDGFFVIPNAFSAVELEKVKKEIQFLRETNGVVAESPDRCAIYPLKAMRQGFLWSKCKFISKYVEKHSMIPFADSFFGQSTMVNDILSVETAAAPVPITNWHPDNCGASLSDISHKRLKLIIYLTDTTAENGAFCYIPKTHVLMEELRNYINASGTGFMITKISDIYNLPQEILSQLPSSTREHIVFLRDEIPDDTYATDKFSICGSAGTLVAFDDNGIHRGGHVSSGVRSILRFSISSRQKFGQYCSRRNLYIQNAMRPFVPQPWRSLL